MTNASSVKRTSYRIRQRRGACWQASFTLATFLNSRRRSQRCPREPPSAPNRHQGVASPNGRSSSSSRRQTNVAYCRPTWTWRRTASTFPRLAPPHVPCSTLPEMLDSSAQYMITASQSTSLYNLLAKKKQFKKTVNFDLRRIKDALNKLGNPERKLKNVINIIGSDGKYSVLNSLKYFIEENKQTTSAYISPSLRDIRERFWMGSYFLSYNEIKKSINKIESLKIQLTIHLIKQ